MNICSYNSRVSKTFTCCDSSSTKSRNISNLSSLLKITTEETRLKILCILKDGSHCVCEIEKHIHASQSLISHHLKDLKQAGILTDEKKGLNVFYSLTKKGKVITNLLFRIDKEVAKL